MNKFRFPPPGPLIAAVLAVLLAGAGAGCDRPGSSPAVPAAAPPPATPAVAVQPPIPPGDGDFFADVTERAGVRFVHQLCDDHVANIIESNGAGGAVLDFDGDGWMDLFLVNSGPLEGVTKAGKGTRREPNRLFRNRGDGTFAPQATYAVGQQPNLVRAADLDGDGAVDLVIANEFGTVSVLRNRGDGTFAPQVTYTIRSYPRSMTATDLDGDGAIDIITANLNSNTVSVLRNLGNGTFAAQAMYVVGITMASMTATDLDGDGAVDLVIAGRGAVAVLRNLGDETLGAQVTCQAA